MVLLYSSGVHSYASGGEKVKGTPPNFNFMESVDTPLNPPTARHCFTVKPLKGPGKDHNYFKPL